jgi:hypothetical protein
MLSSPFAALEIAAVSPFLSASKTLKSRTLCSMLAPWVALEGVTGLGSASCAMVFDISMLSLLFVFDMVVDRCGRWPMLEVRGTEEEEGCRVEEEAEGSRMGKLLLLSVIAVSWAPRESGGGTSPRLDTRLSSERVRVDLERLC